MAKMNFGPYSFESSREDKLFFPDRGITKGDVVDYYARIAEYMIPHLKDRPLTLHRFPDGIDKDGFIQQQAEDYFPKWLTTVTVPKEGGRITHAVADKRAALAYLANQAVIIFHAWLSRKDRIKSPDWIVFDLDPPEGGDFDSVRRAAFAVRDLVEELGLAAYVKTSGSKGLHVISPVRRNQEFEDTRAFAGNVARFLAEREPEQYTTEQRKKKRKGRVFLDTVRNSYGHTMVAPYSLRALPGAPVAAPLEWDEVGDSSLTPDRYTLSNIFRRLSQKEDPWKGMNRRARDLSGPREKLEELLS